jgi:hypothetical protein
MTMPRKAPAGGPDPALTCRLDALSQLIPPDWVEQAAGPDRPHTRLTRRLMLWAVLAMGLFAHLPIREVFRHAFRLGPGRLPPPRNSLCVARRRLGVGPVRALFLRLARPLADGGRLPSALYKGLLRAGLDGTVFSVPDSAANARAFGRPRCGRGAGAFPQVRKLSLVELGTRAELAFVLKPCARSENVMAPALWRHLRPGMLLYLDRQFFGYRLWQQVRRRRAHLLARVKRTAVLAPAERLADGSYLAKIYKGHHDRRRDRGGEVVRVVRYRLDDPRRAGHGQEHRLVTSLLDAAAHPARELIAEYHQRWEEELAFGEQKAHLAGRAPAKPAHLRSETPGGVVQEMYALAIGHYALRALLADAAGQAGEDPKRLSFVGGVRILRLRLQEAPAGEGPATRWYERLRREVGQERAGPRRNRVNPRVVKRKVSKFPAKRRQHRGLPPLTKPFVETIVLLC